MNQLTWSKLLFFFYFALLVHIPEASAGENNHVGRRILDVPEDSEYRNYLMQIQNDVTGKEDKVASWPTEQEVLNALRKRQIRYHPCYFNPVSCFKKRK